MTPPNLAYRLNTVADFVRLLSSIIEAIVDRVRRQRNAGMRALRVDRIPYQRRVNGTASAV
jgi:hypothetical protein